MKKIKDTFKWLFDIKDWKILLRSIPGLVTALFITSVIIMNILASKVIISTKYVGITGGLLLSWIPFLTMDIVVKAYDAKAAIKLNILGLLINLLFIGVFQLVASIQIGGEEGAYDSFDQTFSQTWQIFIASSIAYLISGVVNSLTNAGIGHLTKKNPNGRVAFMLRSYVSTMVGQFVDNFVFASLAFLVFFKLSVGSTFGYTLLSVFGTAVFGALIELGMELIFSPVGYNVCRKWEFDSISIEYQKYHLLKDVAAVAEA